MERPTLAQIQQHYLFSGLAPKSLEDILATSRILELSPEQHIFMQGEEADQFYLVAEGQIKLSRLTMEGNEKVIELLNPGQTFAEAIMFMRSHVYPVTATALSKARVYSFRCKTFLNLLDQQPELYHELLGNLAMRLRKQLQEIENLTMKNASYRVVNYFRQMLEQGEVVQDNVIRLNVQKQVIASRLSIQPETLSRIFAQLKKQDIIATEGRDILIKDVDALYEFE